MADAMFSGDESPSLPLRPGAIGLDDVIPALMIVGPIILAIFAFDLVRRWWRENEWKRQWRKPPDDE
jgi:hypothetical protein